MTVNCSMCIHNEVCGLKDNFYEIQGMCQEADTKYEAFSVNFNCKYYREECNKPNIAYR